ERDDLLRAPEVLGEVALRALRRLDHARQFIQIGARLRDARGAPHLRLRVAALARVERALRDVARLLELAGEEPGGAEHALRLLDAAAEAHLLGDYERLAPHRDRFLPIADADRIGAAKDIDPAAHRRIGDAGEDLVRAPAVFLRERLPRDEAGGHVRVR